MPKSTKCEPVTTRAQWAAQITAVLDQTIRRTVEGFIKMGGMLIEAKRQLEHGEFTTMIQRVLPFGERTAQMLMAIASDKRLTTEPRGSLLPPHWRTLYELTRLPDEALERAFAEGIINPDMERADVQKLLPEPVVIEHEPEPEQPEPTTASPEDAANVAREPVETQREMFESLPRDDDGKVTPDAKKIVKAITAPKRSKQQKQHQTAIDTLTSMIRAVEQAEFMADEIAAVIVANISEHEARKIAEAIIARLDVRKNKTRHKSKKNVEETTP